MSSLSRKETMDDPLGAWTVVEEKPEEEEKEEEGQQLRRNIFQSAARQGQIRETLVGKGFEPAHVEAALSAVGQEDVSKAMEWLFSHPWVDTMPSFDFEERFSAVDRPVTHKPRPEHLESSTTLVVETLPAVSASSAVAAHDVHGVVDSALAAAFSVEEEEPKGHLDGPESDASGLHAVPRMPVEERRVLMEQFLQSVQNEPGQVSEDKMRAVALSGVLRHYADRAVCWKYFLGVMEGPCMKDWTQQLRSGRSRYEALVREYCVDPHSATASQVDLAVVNPLSTADENPWQQFFANSGLRRDIQMDLDRLYPEHPYFRTRDIFEKLERILFVYGCLNAKLGYKQGMHELLAPLLYAMDVASLESAASRPDHPFSSGGSEDAMILAELCDARFVEHDTYLAFELMMEIMQDWFHTPAPTRALGQRPATVPHLPSHPLASADPFASSALFSGTSHAHPPQERNPAVDKCKRLQNVLLKKVDPNLHYFLASLDIEPQVYALRWIRVLLSREFPLEDVMVLWDALFAYKPGFYLLDYLVLAMLTHIRDQILPQDVSGVLLRLFHYPPVEDVHVIIHRAIQLAESPESEWSRGLSILDDRLPPKTAPAASPSSLNAINSARPKSNTLGGQAATEARTILSQLLGGGTGNSGEAASARRVSPPQRIAELELELSKLQSRNSHVSERLERIVVVLHQALMTRGGPEDLDRVGEDAILAVAELKQIRDLLAGHVDEISPVSAFISASASPLNE